MGYKFFTGGKSGEPVFVNEDLYNELLEEMAEDNQNISKEELKEKIKNRY